MLLKLSDASTLSTWNKEIQAKSYCTVFSLFYFEVEGDFQVHGPGGLYLEGQFNEGFFALRV